MTTLRTAASTVDGAGTEADDTAAFDVLSMSDIAALRESATTEFFEAIDRALASETWKNERDLRYKRGTQATFVERRLQQLLNVLNSPERSMFNVIVVLALRDGLRNGDIAVKNWDDLCSLTTTLIPSVMAFAPIIKHYVDSGELLDVIRAVREEATMLNSAPKLLRFFCFEMEEDRSQVPVEIRLELSGFYDKDDVGSCEINGRTVMSEDDLRDEFELLWKRSRARSRSGYLEEEKGLDDGGI